MTSARNRKSKYDTSSLATRERIIDAAGELFCQDGYSGASISKIAKSAGVLSGSLYWVFSSKEELFSEVLRAESENWGEKVVRNTAFPLGDIGDFANSLDVVGEELVNAPRFIRLILVVASERSANTEVTRNVVQKVRAFWRDRMERELLRFTDGFDRDRAEAFARRISRLTTQLIDGIVISMQIEEQDATVEEMLDQIKKTVTREIVHGLAELKAGAA